jgi:hypothetical protein
VVLAFLLLSIQFQSREKNVVWQIAENLFQTRSRQMLAYDSWFIRKLSLAKL